MRCMRQGALKFFSNKMPRNQNLLKRAKITNKKKRSWNAREKLAIVTFFERNPQASKRSVAAKFNIEPKQLRDWLNKKEQLLLAKLHIKKLSTGAKPRYPILEIELFKWVKSLRSNQKVVSRYMIQEKAKILSRKLQYTTIYPKNKCTYNNLLHDFIYNNLENHMIQD